jgi:hypothetical protein
VSLLYGFSLSIYSRLVSVSFPLKVVLDQPRVHVNYMNSVCLGAACTNPTSDLREPRCGTAAIRCYPFPSAFLRSLYTHDCHMLRPSYISTFHRFLNMRLCIGYSSFHFSLFRSGHLPMFCFQMSLI